MRMTIEQILSWPKGMSLKEYEKLLQEQEKTKKRIRRLSNEMYELEDALQVLEDEHGSERYNKKARRLEKAKAEIQRLTA